MGSFTVSRRYVIKLIQELSAHRLITVTNISNSEKGYRANVYRFLWHPWMQTTADRDFRMTVRKKQPRFPAAELVAPPSEQQITRPGELKDTSSGEPEITPLVTPGSPKENNKKRTNYRGKVPVPSSSTGPSKSSFAASPPRKVLSDTTKIILERRIAELRTEISAASKQGNHLKADRLHGELTGHQAALGFTPDDPPPKPKAPRKEEFRDSTVLL